MPRRGVRGLGRLCVAAFVAPDGSTGAAFVAAASCAERRSSQPGPMAWIDP